MNLFAYGSLMCADIMAEVSGIGALSSEPSVLAGFERRCVKGEDYPAIRARTGRRVEGVLYRGLPAGAWARLDRFEGELYRRAEVRVLLRGGKAVSAQTYVLREEFAARLSPERWDFEHFLARGKSRFTRRYVGYDALDQTASPDTPAHAPRTP